MLRFFTFIFLLCLMGATSFLSGMLPLKADLPPAKIKLLSVFSMGILIGTSLVLIIPEGVETLYSSLGESTENAPMTIGFALASGFILMYSLDNAPSLALEVNYLGPVKSVVTNSLTLGLLFHAFVDGVSLGSSFTSSNNTLGPLFFLAIIVHKVPTCFSLASLLMQQGLETVTIHLHIGLFAAMSPISAFVTYVVLKVSGLANDEWVLGILFMFSAGTFLYVVNHVMSEVGESRPGSVDSGITVVEHGMSGLEFGVSLGGMLIPCILSTLRE